MAEGLVLPERFTGKAVKTEIPQVQTEATQPIIQTEVQPEGLIIPERLGGTYQEQPVQPQEPEVDTEQLSEFMATPGMDAGSFVDNLKIAGGMMIATNDEARKDIIRNNFPGVKIYEQGESTIIELPDGEKTVLNKPGLSYQDVYSFLGDMAAFYGPSKLVGFGKGLMSKVAIGGLGAASTQAGLEKGTQFIGSEQEVDPESVMTAGAMGVGGELAGPLIKGIAKTKPAQAIAKKMAERKGAKKLSVARDEYLESVAGIKEAEEITGKTGIPLFRAQKTGALTDLERQSYIASLPGGSRKAAQELKKQNEQTYNAVLEIMDTIAPAGKVETASGKIRSVAQQAIEAKKAIRAEKASPLYKEAFEDKTLLEMTKTKDVIKDIKESYPETGKMASLMNKVGKLIRGKGLKDEAGEVVYEGSTLKKLHGAKLEIDDQLTKFGEGSLGNTEKRELMKVKDSLLDEMDSVNDAYKQARETFADNSPAVNELQDSLIGQIAKLDDTQLKSVAGKIFDPAGARITPGSVRKARKIIEEQDTEAWNEIVRTEFERRLGKMKASPEEAKASIENVPGQLYRAVFGNVQQRKALYAGLDKETSKNLKYVQEGLKKASLGRPGGSQTAVRQILDKELKGGIAGAFQDVVKAPLSIRFGVGAGAGKMAEASYNQKTRALANVMFDPKWIPKLKELRKLNPNSKEAYTKFKQILTSAVKEYSKPAAQAALPERTESPLAGTSR